jgi:hypothetical protein
MMDLYMEAKMREQQRLQEANIERMLRSVKAGRPSERGALRSHLLMWLRCHLATLGMRPQTQWK